MLTQIAVNYNSNRGSRLEWMRKQMPISSDAAIAKAGREILPTGRIALSARRAGAEYSYLTRSILRLFDSVPKVTR